MNSITTGTTRIHGAHAKMRQDPQAQPDGRSPRRGRRSFFEILLEQANAQDHAAAGAADRDDASEQIADTIRYNQILKRMGIQPAVTSTIFFATQP